MRLNLEFAPGDIQELDTLVAQLGAATRSEGIRRAVRAMRVLTALPNSEVVVRHVGTGEERVVLFV